MGWIVLLVIVGLVVVFTSTPMGFARLPLRIA
jgi:hypothetical protein